MAEIIVDVRANIDKFRRDIQKALSDSAGKGVDVGGDFTGGIRGGITGGGGGSGAIGGAGQIVGKLGLMLGALGVIAAGIEQIVRFMTKASPALGGTLKLFENAILNIIRPFGDALSILLQPIAIAFLEFSTKVQEFLSGFLPAVQLLSEPFNNIILPTIEGLAELLDEFLGILSAVDWSQVAQQVQELANAFVEGIGAFLEDVGNFASDVYTKITDTIDSSLETFGDLGQYLFDQIKGIIDAAIEFFNSLNPFGGGDTGGATPQDVIRAGRSSLTQVGGASRVTNINVNASFEDPSLLGNIIASRVRNEQRFSGL